MRAAGILLHANAGGDKQPSLIDRIVDYLAERKLDVPEIELVSTYTLQPDENAKPMVTLPSHCTLGQSVACLQGLVLVRGPVRQLLRKLQVCV